MTMRKFSWFVFGFVVAASAAVASAAGIKPINRRTMAGPYRVTLKVLPAESFAGKHAEMTWDGGAAAVHLTSTVHPNRHLVAFIEEHGKPVQNAAVAIRYRRMAVRQSTWRELPVARMHVRGKSLATTHFGNNVRLQPGSYEAEVTVDGHHAPIVHFMIGPRPSAHSST